MRRRSPARSRQPNLRGYSFHFPPGRLGDFTTVDFRQEIVNQANAQGVPVALALAVATQESGIHQWRSDGSLVVSSAGAIGIFQLMPDTAAQLGVDPTDPLDNIRGGVMYLAQMFAQFGNWSTALAAYNWGPAKMERALQSGRQIPASVQTYVMSIMAAAGLGNAVMQAASPSPAYSDLPASTSSDDQGFAPIAQTGNSNLPLVLGMMALTIYGVNKIAEWIDG